MKDNFIHIYEAKTLDAIVNADILLTGPITLSAHTDELRPY